MSARTILVGMVVSVAFDVWAQDPGEVLERANLLYQQNKFAEAREAYDLLVRNGYQSGGLYYNLGNACYKMGDLSHAILNYERGLRLMPNDEDLRFNLLRANLMTTDKITPVPKIFLWEYWDEFKGGFSAAAILWITYACYAMVIASLTLLVIARSYAARKGALIASFCTGVLFLFFLLVCVSRLSDLSREDEAIIVAEIVTVKNSPDAKSTDAFVLHGGVKIQITDQVNEWLQIRLADGKVGWMEGSATETI